MLQTPRILVLSLKDQPRQKVAPGEKLGNRHRGRLVGLLCRLAVAYYGESKLPAVPRVAIDRRDRTGKYARVQYDGSRMPVRYPQRQEQLSPVRYWLARHRRCELRYPKEYRKTFTHRIVFYLGRRAWGRDAE